MLPYCCQDPSSMIVGSTLFIGFARKTESRRADSTAFLLQLRVIHQRLQGVAEACKSRISRRVSILWFAACCTVLRSRWYQSGVKSTRVHFVQHSAVPILRPTSQRTQVLSSYSPHSNPLLNCKKHLQPAGQPPVLCTVAESVRAV